MTLNGRFTHRALYLRYIAELLVWLCRHTTDVINPCNRLQLAMKMSTKLRLQHLTVAEGDDIITISQTTVINCHIELTSEKFSNDTENRAVSL